MTRTWILVAESSRAKIYATENRTAIPEEVEDIVHPEGRLHEGDLVTDKPGNDPGSVGQGPHVLDDKVSATRQEHIEFAKELAERLEAGRTSGRFDRLAIAAPPAFLGLLREKLSREVKEKVFREIDKNLVRLPPEELRNYVWD
ncbi:MAG TPA: host attachment protein [Gammaproteobacteria bacterium]|nr:host attachment protein [Gammaproteobacteria bacterium]